jgi:hypothetical protein
VLNGQFLTCVRQRRPGAGRRFEYDDAPPEALKGRVHHEPLTSTLLSPLTNLRHLALGSTQIDAVDLPLLAPFTELEYLELNHNDITNLSSLPSFAHLQTLQVS